MNLTFDAAVRVERRAAMRDAAGALGMNLAFWAVCLGLIWMLMH